MDIENFAKKIQKAIVENYSELSELKYNHLKTYLKTEHKTNINVLKALELILMMNNIEEISLSNKQDNVDFIEMVIDNYCDSTLMSYRCRVELIRAPNFRVPTIEMIKKEIESIISEYGEDFVCFRRDSIIVTTNNIVLNDINLGPFEIELDLKSDLGRSISNYYDYFVAGVEATDPNPSAAGNYVHPNVNNNALCMGDSRDMAFIALQECRIFDYFDIINITLNTYGEDSPYVSLDDWFGIQCCDCEGHYNPDSGGTYVECCDKNYCDGCSYYCEYCMYPWCDNCNSLCEKCEVKICNDCAYVCEMCDELFCSDCCSSSLNFCKKCYEKRKQDDDDDYVEDNEPGFL